MFLKLLNFIPLSIYLLGNVAIGNNTELFSNKVNSSSYGIRSETYSVYHNSYHTFSDFDVTPSDILGNGIHIKVKGLHHSDYYKFIFEVYNSDGRDFDDVGDFYRNPSGGTKKWFPLDFYFSEADEYWGIVTFRMKLWRLQGGAPGHEETYFYFKLYFGDARAKRSSVFVPYEARIRNSEGYCISYGEYFEIRNMKSLFNIPTYMKWNFNDSCSMYLYGETYSSSLSGYVYLTMYPDGGYYSASNKEYATHLFKGKNIGLSYSVSNGNRVYPYVGRYYYIDNKRNMSYSESNVYNKKTQDFYFPKHYYDVFDSIEFTIYFSSFGRSDIVLYDTFKIKFLEDSKYEEYSFEVIGEYPDPILDEELVDIYL